MDLARLYEAIDGSALAREITQMEEDRASLRQALAQSDTFSRLVREFMQQDSSYAGIAKKWEDLQSPAVNIAQQYSDLLGDGRQALDSWQEAERAKSEHIRRMLDPIAGIRNSLLMDSATQIFAKEFANGGSVVNHMQEFMDQVASIGTVDTMLAQQWRSLGVGSSIRSYLEDFERINKQWDVPSEVLGLADSLNSIHEQLGKVALPTIDWASAGALAAFLGQDGIEEQLALVGIAPDGGMMHPPASAPEKGILSRTQNDAITLINLLLAFLFVAYQDYTSSLQQAKTKAFQTQTATTLQKQAQQIQSLTALIEKALVQAAQDSEELFVVRDRVATVRSRPKHGATIEGKLFPNEVVQAIDRDGKWVEVEYYHWLHEEYRTGWVMKKYLERVPANYVKNPSVLTSQ